MILGLWTGLSQTLLNDHYDFLLIAGLPVSFHAFLYPHALLHVSIRSEHITTWFQPRIYNSSPLWSFHAVATGNPQNLLTMLWVTDKTFMAHIHTLVFWYWSFARSNISRLLCSLVLLGQFFQMRTHHLRGSFLRSGGVHRRHDWDATQPQPELNCGLYHNL